MARSVAAVGKQTSARAYVIDACFARGVGEAKSDRAIRCHELLARILLGEHVCVFNKTLRDEWSAHASKTVTSWLTSLVSKKLYRRDDLAASEALSKALQVAKLSDKAEREIEKDAHLLHLCLCYGKRLVSFEKQLQRFLQQDQTLALIANAIEWIADEPEKIPLSKSALTKVNR
jgi:hypothetical protein